MNTCNQPILRKHDGGKTHWSLCHHHADESLYLLVRGVQTYVIQQSDNVTPHRVKSSEQDLSADRVLLADLSKHAVGCLPHGDNAICTIAVPG